MSKHNKNHARDLAMMFKYMIGQPVDKIAKEAGVSTSTLYKVLKINNIPLKTEKEARAYFRQKIFYALAKEKKTVNQISEELGLHPDLVNGYIRYEYDQIAKNEAKKKVSSKPLGKDGLIGSLQPSNKKGLNISQTVEEKARRDQFEKNAESVQVDDEKLVEIFGDEFNDTEKVKLVILRELLRYASSVTNMPDYSNDPLLLPDYLLPIDIVIMKDITTRSINGENINSIANVHRTDIDLVVDLVEKGLARDEFRNRFIKSLIRRGLIQL